MTTETQTSSANRPLRTSTCQSLSGKSTLTYCVGIDADSSLYIQLMANSGAGRFNEDSIPYGAISDLLRHHQGTEIRSATLKGLGPQKSTNSPGFMAAVLLNEGLLQPMPN